MSSNSAVLQIEDYTFWYLRQEGDKLIRTKVLDNVNLEIRRGEFVLLLGPTSSGKTTLCLNILGVLPDLLGGRSEGKVLLHDNEGLVDRSDIPLERRFLAANMVFQDPNDQLVALTVEDEIAFAMENYQVPRDEMVRRIDEVLGIVGMTDFKFDYVSTLSGGEKQRVAIAAMLALRPRLLLLDQPTSNLDPVGTMQVLETIRNIRQTLDITILLVEHARDGVFETADQVFLFADKTIKFSGTPRALIEQYGMELRDRYGLWMPQASEVGLALREQGVEVDPIPVSRDEVARVLNEVGLVRGTDVPEGVLAERKYQRTGSEEPILRVRDLSFSYPTREGVLRDVSFEVYSGETLAILGQNGSGKTTLISHLPGILKPTSGDVIVKGINTKSAKIQDLARHVAFVFQYPDRQFITTSVEAELAHSLKASKTPPEEIERRVEEVLDRIGLKSQRKEHPFSLSHGQKRRLSVACMQIAEPELIILDEPTFGLDWQQVTRLMDYLYELTIDRGATTMFVTHDMRLVAKYAQRVIVLHDSRLVFEGSPNELFANTDVLEKTKLSAPPVWYFAEQAIGRGLAQPEELSALVAEVRKR